MIPQQIFEYLASEPNGVLSAIEEISSDPRHQLSPYINELLTSIPENLVFGALMSDDYKFIYSDSRFSEEEKYRQTRIWFLRNYISKEIEKSRFEIIKKQFEFIRPEPYNHPAIKDLELDHNYLVPLREFKVEEGVLLRNGFGFAIVPPLQDLNSSYWFTRVLSKPQFYDHVKVRLDPFLVRPSEEFTRKFYKMLWYGKSLDWERIKRLKEDEHGRWESDDSVLGLRDIGLTDYVWAPRDSDIHFLCEELPKETKIELRGSRYFHAIYNPEQENFIHMDGAIRFYSPENYGRRLSSHVRLAGKSGIRIKVFQINSNISRDELNDLILSFFVWNEDVKKYFSM